MSLIQNAFSKIISYFRVGIFNRFLLVEFSYSEYSKPLVFPNLKLV